MIKAVADVRPALLPDGARMEPTPEKAYSRCRGEPASLPPAGKIAVTVAMLWLSVWMFAFKGSPASGLIVFGFPLYVIRETWRRRPIN